jgi:3'(2'), 5'-bisphosphate nucleotidase
MGTIPQIFDERIRRVIRQCGLQIEHMVGQGFEVSEKGPEDYVTTIDAALDHQISTALASFFPVDGIISEENAASRQYFLQPYERHWCIDPLDGTEDLIMRRQHYAVMVGVLMQYRPIAGWIYAPNYDRMYFGGKDWGLFQTQAEGEPEMIPRVEPSLQKGCRLLIGHRDLTRYGAAIAQQISGVEFYSLGSFGLKVLEVITGNAGLYLYLNQRVKIWDTAGPLALALEAGLTCCTLEGEPLQFSPQQVDAETLTHQQSIIIGWAEFVETLRPKLAKAVQMTLLQS